MISALHPKEEIIDDELPVDSKGRVICKYCSKPIERVKLIGFSLVCPLCGMPQNGVSHPEK